jgi:hypothetical protein
MTFAVIITRQDGTRMVLADPGWHEPGDVGKALGIPAFGLLQAVHPDPRLYRFTGGPFTGDTAEVLPVIDRARALRAAPPGTLSELANGAGTRSQFASHPNRQMGRSVTLLAPGARQTPDWDEALPGDTQPQFDFIDPEADYRYNNIDE